VKFYRIEFCSLWKLFSNFHGNDYCFVSTGSLQASNYGYGSYMGNNTGKPASQRESKTFLTATDVPMKLAKHLEMASTLSRSKNADYLHSKNLNIEQFCYDFHLERKTLENCGFR